MHKLLGEGSSNLFMIPPPHKAKPTPVYLFNTTCSGGAEQSELEEYSIFFKKEKRKKKTKSPSSYRKQTV